MVAVLRNNLVLANRFLNEGADKDQANVWGETPLMRAVQNQSKVITNALIEKGADVNKADHKGQTPMMLAVLNKDLSLVASLNRSGADVNLSDKEGKTALMLAYERGDVKMVDLLVNVLEAKTKPVAQKVGGDLEKSPLYVMYKMLNPKERLKLLSALPLTSPLSAYFSSTLK